MTTTLNASTAGAGGFIATSDNSGVLALQTAGTTAITVDASQNVGIGNTPSSWATYKVAQVGGGTADVSVASNNDDTNISTNAYYNAGWKYQSSSTLAERYQQGAGTHRWYYAPSGTAGNAITWSEAMRIDSSGNLLVATTSPTYGGVGSCRSTFVSPTSGGAGLFYTNYSGDVSTSCLNIGKYDNNNTSSQIFVKFAINSAGLGSGQINANGSGAATFASFSDSRLKNNIVDLPSQLANIMALRPVEYDYIESEGGGHQIGFVAQEVKEIYPDLVGERADGMYTLSDMNKNDARLIKCIQEMKTLIDTQAETINALTARIVALEQR